MRLVTTNGLAVRHPGHVALHDVDFHIDRGEIVTIVGPNGSGKTTLLRAFIGAIKPSDGTVERMAGLRIGYVPQKLHIEPTLPITVERFLSLPNRFNRAQSQTALERAGVPNLGKRQMTSLSGGQFQRVLLARAILSDTLIKI